MILLRLFTGLLFLCLALPASQATACVCGSFPIDFFGSISANSTPEFFEGYHIVKGSIVGLTPNGAGARMKLIHQYYGAPTDDTITIWKSYGDDCRLSPQGFYQLPNDTFIFAMRHLTGRLAAYEELTDYTISYCGAHFLRVKGDSVLGGGPGSFTFTGYPLSAFEDSLGQQLHTLAVTLPVHTSAATRLYPNPAKDQVTLEWEQQRPGEVHIILQDGMGKVVKIVPANQPGIHYTTLLLDELVNGIYYIRVSTETMDKALKVMVRH